MGIGFTGGHMRRGRSTAHGIAALSPEARRKSWSTSPPKPPRARISAWARWRPAPADICSHGRRSEEHTSELQSLMRISYAVFCLKKKNNKKKNQHKITITTTKQTTECYTINNNQQQIRQEYTATKTSK